MDETMEIPEGEDFNKYGWQMRSRCPCGAGHSTVCCGFASDLVNAAVKEERERCAKIAEGHKAGRCRLKSCCGGGIAKAIRES